MKNLEKKALAYSLKNALAYKGKAQQGSVISALFNEGLKKEDMKKYGKIISEIVNKVNSLSLEEQEEEFQKLKELISERDSREGLPELPNAKKGIVMRFRPSPSGPLHIGHIISTLISSLYVKKYNGKFYVIIDDTDPKTTLKEAYENIKNDCEWIFDNVSEYINSSDRNEIYYKYAKKLIKNKSAYVCTCSGDKFRELSKNKKDCPCRKLNTESNLERWLKMLSFDGKFNFKEGEAVLRFKTKQGMKHPNPAMRDFPLARICEHEHPKQGKKYRVWPLMNLAVAVDDIELKMTHVIRGKDHRDNAERQKMIYTALGLEKKFPWTAFIGRIKFKDILLSKRKIKVAIESGEFKDFEDERLPTIASLRKRGFHKDGFIKFAEQRGLTEVDKVINQKDFFEIINNFTKNL